MKFPFQAPKSNCMHYQLDKLPPYLRLRQKHRTSSCTNRISTLKFDSRTKTFGMESSRIHIGICDLRNMVLYTRAGLKGEEK